MFGSFKIQFAIILSSLSFTASAQSLWTLEKCINYAMENNLSIKNADIEKEMQNITLWQTRFNQLPSIGGSVGVGKSYGRSVDPSTNTYSDVSNLSNSYGISGSMTLFSGFALRNRIAFERYNLKAVKSRLEQQKNEIIYQTIDSYYKYLFSSGIYLLSKENLKLMQEQHFSTKRLIDVGRKAESDIFDFDAKLANDSFLLIQQEGDVEKKLLALKIVMNYPLEDTLAIDTAQLVVLNMSDSVVISNLLESSKSNLPGYKTTEYLLMASKKSLAQVRGNFSPSLSLGAGWNTGYYKKIGSDADLFRDQFKNNAGYSVGLTLNIPIFSRFSRISDLKKAKLNYKLAEIAHHRNMNELENEVNSVYIDWLTSKKEFASARRQLEKYQIAYTLAEKKLQLGQLNVIEFYLQKNDLQRAKTDILRTQLQLALQNNYIRFLLTGEWF